MAGTRGTAAREVGRLPVEAAAAVVEHYPALAASRDRLLELLPDGPRERVVEVVRSDVGLAIAVIRLANRGSRARRAGSAAAAVEELEPAVLGDLARRMPVFDFFERPSSEYAGPVRFALHAVAVQRVAASLWDGSRHGEREGLLTASLLHDIGKLALACATPGYGEGLGHLTPAERLGWERRELGVDHAQVGAELARRLGFPDRLADAIAHHHDEQAQGEPGLVRLADLLAHFQQNESVEPLQLQKAALAVGLGRDRLGMLMYDLAYPIEGATPEAVPCPLTPRELDVLRELAAGRVYKQAASALGVSVSTVRNHAHNAYLKLDVADRTQAVVLASERGWL